jgi:hypothetical protein
MHIRRPKLSKSRKGIRHGDSCFQRVELVETGQFSGISIRCGSGDPYTFLVLGVVGRGYPTAKKRRSGCYFYESETTAKKPWTATIWVPEDQKQGLACQLQHYEGDMSRRIGPFATRQEGLEALEAFWLRRLGVSP